MWAPCWVSVCFPQDCWDILRLISNLVRVNREEETIKSDCVSVFCFVFALTPGSSNILGRGRSGCETNDEITFLLILHLNEPSLPAFHVAGGRNMLSGPRMPKNSQHMMQSILQVRQNYKQSSCLVR